MATKRLTEKLCERVRPPKTGYAMVWDSVIPGLGLRVSSRGRKAWTFVFRFGGKKQRLGFGTFPTVGLGAARGKAKEAIETIDANENPAKVGTLRRRQVADTVAAAVEDFDKRHLQTLRDGAKAKRILERELVERLGDMRLDAVRRAHVLDLVDDVADRGTPIAANRALAWAKRFFAWCVDRDLVEANPAAGVKRPGKETPRDRVLSNSELRAVWLVAADAPYPFGPLVRALLLTGARPGEVAAMRWEDVDLEAKAWRLPASATKAARAHEVPLTDPMVALLEAVPRRDEQSYVFGRARPYADRGAAKAKLDAEIAARAAADEAMTVAPWRLHDLRRTVATGLAGLGVSTEVIAAVLNHAPIGVTQRHYAHHRYAAEKRAALDRWAARIDRVVAGKAEKVVSLGR